MSGGTWQYALAVALTAAGVVAHVAVWLKRRHARRGEGFAAHADEAMQIGGEGRSAFRSQDERRDT